MGGGGGMKGANRGEEGGKGGVEDGGRIKDTQIGVPCGFCVGFV